jgi:hypothetical protein
MIPDTTLSQYVSYFCGVVFSADDVWSTTTTGTARPGPASETPNAFKVMYRISDTEAAGYDTNGNYWTFSDGTWTQGEAAPDTTAMKPNSWTNVATVWTTTGDWYAFVPGRAHKSSDTFGGETRQGYDVYKWTASSGCSRTTARPRRPQ